MKHFFKLLLLLLLAMLSTNCTSKLDNSIAIKKSENGLTKYYNSEKSKAGQQDILKELRKYNSKFFEIGSKIETPLEFMKNVNIIQAYGKSQNHKSHYIVSFRKNPFEIIDTFNLRTDSLHSIYSVSSKDNYKNSATISLFESKKILNTFLKKLEIQSTGEINLIHYTTNSDEIFEFLPESKSRSEYYFYEKDSTRIEYFEKMGLEPETIAFHVLITSPKQCQLSFRHMAYSKNNKYIQIENQSEMEKNYVNLTNEQPSFKIENLKLCEGEILNL